MNSEFLFVVDCSGSMRGTSIRKASECLNLFIRSLPPNSYFNIYRFGSRFEKLFETSYKYTDQTAEQGIQLSKSFEADLGGTEIFGPLKDIFDSQPLHGQRQIFILTDGEVCDVESVLRLISMNAINNRCFATGIGRGCDAGLVEGMASSSGGKSDFVQEGDSISEKVIPQLQSSLNSPLINVEIHLEGENTDNFMISPFPIQPINSKGASVVYLRGEKKSFNNGMLVNGVCGKKQVDFLIEKVDVLNKIDEDIFGCCGGKNLANAISPLFAFSFIKSIENKISVSDTDKQKAIEVSISSGVLCKYTGYVGMTNLRSKYNLGLDYNVNCSNIVYRDASPSLFHNTIKFSCITPTYCFFSRDEQQFDEILPGLSNYRDMDRLVLYNNDRSNSHKWKLIVFFFAVAALMLYLLCGR